MSNTPDYDFICSNKSIEMQLAKEYYHWDKLDNTQQKSCLSKILSYYFGLINNKKRIEQIEKSNERFVKFSNGNILTIKDEAGYRLFKITKANTPTLWIENHCYKFSTDLVYRYPLKNTG